MINRAPAEALMARYDTTEKADAALAALKEYWDELLSHFTISSSEEKLDRMVNVWHQYQCMVTFNMSRSASYFESGIGRGMGSRIVPESAFSTSPQRSLRTEAHTISTSHLPRRATPTSEAVSTTIRCG